MNSSNVQYLTRQMLQDVNYNRNTLKRPFPSDVEDGPKRCALAVSLTASDDGRKLKSTAIAGHRIACFVVGGEPRLCLPQLLRLIVDRIDVEQVESARRKLSVNLAQCEADQLAALRDAKVLPLSVTSCGLVTLSDAARLVSGLSEFLRNDDAINQDRKLVWSFCADDDFIDSNRKLALSTDDSVNNNDRKWVSLLSAVNDVTEHHRKLVWSRSASDDVVDRDRKWLQSTAENCEQLPVSHSCFGGCSGMLIRRQNTCIRCDQCSTTMSPEVFVTHSHHLDAESRGTCHWGFDAARWRYYIMLNSSVMTSPEVVCRLQAALDGVKQLHDDEFPVGCRQVKRLYYS